MPRRLYNRNDEARRVGESRFAVSSAESYREPWRRDYARLIHSAAFRRLQGKTQLFPNHESDFFRNRLTHSLEVAQIAKSIAIRLNATESIFSNQKIEPAIVEVAALAHDLGHPPFGHNGEEALDDEMREFGGFEGNAQTLRILCRIEKKRTFEEQFISVDKDGHDKRAGLNLTARVMGAVLKYDREIPRTRKSRKAGEVVKGYYYTERAEVEFIKTKILGSEKCKKGEFKTLECWIMDVADDIAYSTYDIEDGFKGGFITPISMIAAKTDLLENIARTVKARIDRFYPDCKTADKKFSTTNARDILITTFKGLLDLEESEISGFSILEENTSDFLKNPDAKAFIIAKAYENSDQLSSNGYRRTQLTSDLVGRFIRGVELIPNPTVPPLSKVRLRLDIFKEVETLKVFAFESLINSSQLKLAEHSGKGIVKTMFERLCNDESGFMLLPEDFRKLHQDIEDPHEKARVICDFIAGMTDRYAIDFYSRLTSPNETNIWRPI